MTKIKELEDKAMTEANEAIRYSTEGEYELALDHWEAAERIIQAEFELRDMYYWIKSGIGDTLFQLKDYEGSIAASLAAREWTLANGVPLPSICLGRSYFALGYEENATAYLLEAYRLAGDALAETLDDQEKVFLDKIVSTL
ncbi:hypothetical protein ACFQZE_19160 [Paenibacillus sp. GCM10027627]|uniref:hypothetical protein n=1 Tax=unclassified Paenibacillus TaxID=185978 RepID=UPI0036447506